MPAKKERTGPSRQQLEDAGRRIYEAMDAVLAHPENGYISATAIYRGGVFSVFVIEGELGMTLRKITALYTSCPAFWEIVEEVAAQGHQHSQESAQCH